LNPEKRKSLYSQAQDLLVEKETPVIPLFNSVRQLLISKRLENPPVNRLEHYSYNKVSNRSSHETKLDAVALNGATIHSDNVF
jgi:ABC-type oligopeptide transport system substrate-binding subunit